MATQAWTHSWIWDGQGKAHAPVAGGNLVQGIASCLHQGWLGCALLPAPQRAGTHGTRGVAHVAGGLHVCGGAHM